MARIDELLAQIGDDHLREELSDAVADLRDRKKFGLVYEEHVPETVHLAAAAGVTPGSTVMLRREPVVKTRWTVEKLSSGTATITDGVTTRADKVADLLVVKSFGDPVYPVLRIRDSVARSADRPFHTIINGENFHALQLLQFTHAASVDCIYIDPPYNTGARDWKYNNDYVDSQDTWRHSKWLSFMEKRLRLAKRLLKEDAVLIVTIDENELHHLSLLLEELFPQARRQAVTICINPSGSSSGGLSRVEEYAIFCFLGNSGPNPLTWDLMDDRPQVTPRPELEGFAGNGFCGAGDPGIGLRDRTSATRCYLTLTPSASRAWVHRSTARRTTTERQRLTASSSPGPSAVTASSASGA